MTEYARMAARNMERIGQAEANFPKSLDELTTDSIQRTNTQIGRLLFWDKQRLIGTTDERQEPWIAERDRNHVIVLGSRVSMILVRPEMYAIREKIVGFLKWIWLDILMRKDFNPLDIDRYWKIGEDVIMMRDTAISCPTRALVYTSGPCEVVVFRTQRGRTDFVGKFARDHKGVAGLPDKNTLRGWFVYEHSKDHWLHNAPVGSDVQIATDPILIHRHTLRQALSKGQWIYKASGVQEEDLLLTKAGVWVHVVENGLELIRDLRAVLTEDEFLEILSSIKS